jgi:hypothetical protein
MWLWHPQDHLAFHVCERAGRYAEFADEARFESEVDELARLAAAGSLKNEQLFHSVHAALTFLEARAVGSHSHWDHYNALMASLACGQIEKATRHFLSLLRLDAPHDWSVSLQGHAKQVMDAARQNMIATVQEQVDLTRVRLRLPTIRVFPSKTGEA